jgi:septal ring factor EnvC (AmiA/AmiB activator)
MKRLGQKAVISVVVIVFVIALIAGCSEQELPGVKKSRLIATENRQLKKELDLRSEEIESQRGLLEKCLEEKKTLQEKAQKDTEELVTLVLESFDEENKKLKEENKNLKAQIEELEKQLEELEKRAGPKPL